MPAMQKSPDHLSGADIDLAGSPLRVRLIEFAGRRVLLAAPNVKQFGHLGLEMLFAMAQARALGANLYLVRPRKVVSEALFEVETDEVRILRTHPVGSAFAKGCWAAQEVAEAIRHRTDHCVSVLKAEAAGQITRYDATHEESHAVRKGLKKVKHALRTSGEGRGKNLYYRRRLIRQPVHTFLRKEAEERAVALAARYDITPATPLVSVHVREGGWKRGREIQDVKPGSRDDSVRNARIDTHFDAIDFLVRQGYRVVRVGDPTMTPVTRPGVLDLATMATRDPLLELYCLFRSRFLLCGESGPFGIALLTNTPILAVNCSDPISPYPIRPDAMYVLKRVFDRQTGREMDLREILTEEYLSHVRETTRYAYVENTSGEILLAVREMLDLLDRQPDRSPAQQTYHELISTVVVQMPRLSSYMRKWGADQGFLGDGRIARFCVERDFGDEAAVPSTAAAAGPA